MKKTQKTKLISYLQTFLDFQKVVKLLLTCLKNKKLNAAKTLIEQINADRFQKFPHQSAQSDKSAPNFIRF